MFVVVSVVFILYFLLIIFLLVGWNRATQKVPLNNARPKISVIIPVRNESGNILSLLEDLQRQVYPKSAFEVIIADDHSEDDTVRIITAWCADNRDLVLSLLELKETSGKKEALKAAIEKASGEIIVTTDADCQAGPHWLVSVAEKFTADVQMVIGPVRLEDSTSVFGLCQQMEFMVLSAAGAATMGLGIPTMCNGANLAFRKGAYMAVGGYAGNEHIASGDDEFLLRKIASQFRGGVTFLHDRRGMVMTKPMNSWSSLLQQRIRWAGKWRKHGFGFSAFMALLIFLAHAAVVVTAVLYASTVLKTTVLLFIALKALADLLLILSIRKFYRVPFRAHLFLLMQLFYPFYVVFFGLVSNILTAEWKGRKI